MLGLLGTIFLNQMKKLNMLNNYEHFLKQAYREGWRDPVQITNLEIEAYQAGMMTERKRVLQIFESIMDEPVMRIIDIKRKLDKVRNPNNPV